MSKAVGHFYLRKACITLPGFVYVTLRMDDFYEWNFDESDELLSDSSAAEESGLLTAGVDAPSVAVSATDPTSAVLKPGRIQLLFKHAVCHRGSAFWIVDVPPLPYETVIWKFSVHMAAPEDVPTSSRQEDSSEDSSGSDLEDLAVASRKEGASSCSDESADGSDSGSDLDPRNSAAAGPELTVSALRAAAGAQRRARSAPLRYVLIRFGHCPNLKELRINIVGAPPHGLTGVAIIGALATAALSGAAGIAGAATVSSAGASSAGGAGAGAGGSSAAGASLRRVAAAAAASSKPSNHGLELPPPRPSRSFAGLNILGAAPATLPPDVHAIRLEGGRVKWYLTPPQAAAGGRGRAPGFSAVPAESRSGAGAGAGASAHHVASADADDGADDDDDDDSFADDDGKITLIDDVDARAAAILPQGPLRCKTCSCPWDRSCRRYQPLCRRSTPS